MRTLRLLGWAYLVVLMCWSVDLLMLGAAQAAESITLSAPKEPARPDDTFVRLFPGLPPFAPATDEMREKARQLGQKGGILDAHDLPTATALDAILNPVATNPDNPAMTAGMTFLGQFIDHDLTLDPRSPIFEVADPRRTKNFRTAAFDLDSVYGNGPKASPELYDLSSGDIKLKVDVLPDSPAVSRKGAVRYDVPRDAYNVAIIGDGRNDENVIISQLHLAVLRFHNAVVDHLRTKQGLASLSADQVFKMAQRLVRWHYQWIVVHEFLPLTIGQDLVDDILRRGPKYYNPHDTRLQNAQGNPLIPVEFSVAAYRFGHSQVRPSYRLNFGPQTGGDVFLFAFLDALEPNDSDPDDLRGGKRARRRFVDWQTFFRFSETASLTRPNKRIDTKLSSILLELLGDRSPSPGMPSDGVQSLASRNLMRHVNFGLPSGQAVARLMGAPVLTPAQLADLETFGMERSTPLWFYILREAEVLQSGLRLGPVGGRIVGEVFIGLLKADAESYLNQSGIWKPVLPSAVAGDFRMTDLLNFAGVVPPLN